MILIDSLEYICSDKDLTSDNFRHLRGLVIKSLSANDNLVLVDFVCYHNVDKVSVVNGPYSTVLHVDQLA